MMSDQCHYHDGMQRCPLPAHHRTDAAVCRQYGAHHHPPAVGCCCIGATACHQHPSWSSSSHHPAISSSCRWTSLPSHHLPINNHEAVALKVLEARIQNLAAESTTRKVNVPLRPEFSNDVNDTLEIASLAATGQRRNPTRDREEGQERSPWCTLLI